MQNQYLILYGKYYIKWKVKYVSALKKINHIKVLAERFLLKCRSIKGDKESAFSEKIHFYNTLNFIQ